MANAPFLARWPIEEWPEEDRALALRLQEVAGGRCWITSKIGVGQPVDELAAAVDEIELSDDLAEATGEPPARDVTVGDISLGGFYLEWEFDPPGYSSDRGFDTIWHVHPGGVRILTIWEWEPPIEADIPEAEASPEQLEKVCLLYTSDAADEL